MGPTPGTASGCPLHPPRAILSLSLFWVHSGQLQPSGGSSPGTLLFPMPPGAGIGGVGGIGGPGGLGVSTGRKYSSLPAEPSLGQSCPWRGQERGLRALCCPQVPWYRARCSPALARQGNPLKYQVGDGPGVGAGAGSHSIRPLMPEFLLPAGAGIPGAFPGGVLPGAGELGVPTLLSAPQPPKCSCGESTLPCCPLPPAAPCSFQTPWLRSQ